MPITLPPAAETLLDDGGILYQALHIATTPTPISITPHDYAITHKARSYVKSDSLLSLGKVKKTGEARINTWTFELSTTDLTWSALFFAGEMTNVPIEYDLLILDPADYSVAGFLAMFEGAISGFKLQENASVSKIRVECASLFADFSRRVGRLTNPDDQEIYYPGDGASFEFANNPVPDQKWRIK